MIVIAVAALKWNCDSSSMNIIIYHDKLHVPEYRGELVAALPNMALGKEAAQSTTKWKKGPSYAVDGHLSGLCSTTDAIEPDPWWSVDLRQHYRVAEVHFFTSMQTMVSSLT